jgi:hypothetical protein
MVVVVMSLAQMGRKGAPDKSVGSVGLEESKRGTSK